MQNIKTERIHKAYELLGDITPKKYDCGILCTAACCRENQSHGDGEYGMLLLPGESEMLSDIKDFCIKSSENGCLLTCKGSCERALRPFACRIFPFYPEICKKGNRYTVRILPDPRANGVCPIVNDFRKRKTNIRFLRNAKKAVRVLLHDEDIARELCSQSDMLCEIRALREKIFKSGD